jgi:hypothetical protein
MQHLHLVIKNRMLQVSADVGQTKGSKASGVTSEIQGLNFSYLLIILSLG